MPDHSSNPFIEARNAGLSPIPCDVFTKRPQISWKRYQDEIAELEQCIDWHDRGWALGIVCGKVSDRLICLDFEAEFMPQLPLLAERMRTAGTYDLFKTWIDGYCESTPRGGMHVLVHLSGDGPVPGNTKLATAANGHVLVETRGEGGYCIVAPSPGYKLLSGGLDGICHALMEEWWQA